MGAKPHDPGSFCGILKRNLGLHGWDSRKLGFHPGTLLSPLSLSLSLVLHLGAFQMRNGFLHPTCSIRGHLETSRPFNSRPPPGNYRARLYQMCPNVLRTEKACWRLVLIMYHHNAQPIPFPDCEYAFDPEWTICLSLKYLPRPFRCAFHSFPFQFLSTPCDFNCVSISFPFLALRFHFVPFLSTPFHSPSLLARSAQGQPMPKKCSFSNFPCQ